MYGKNKFDILNNAIDAKLYSYNSSVREKIRREFNIKEDELVVGHVGRFAPQKNHSFLIDVFAQVKKRNPKSKLLLVGEGELMESIQNKVRALHLTDDVIFAGLRTDVCEMLQAPDVFVMPSLFEGLPLVMIEAQAAGLPCVISDKVPIECKKTEGLVFQLGLQEDYGKWADKIMGVSMNERKNTYEEIKKAGFDIRENACKLEKMYLEKYFMC